jgi:hypothetical protein
MGENAKRFHGTGFLGDHDLSEACFSWARKLFLKYRKMALVVVNALAEQEYQAGKQEQEKAERNQHFRQAAEYYAWCMKTAMHHVLDARFAERSRDRAMFIYREELKKTRTAEKIRKSYEKLRKGRNVEVDDEE